MTFQKCTCKFKEKCWVNNSDGCTIIPSEYKMCYEYMRRTIHGV